MPRSPERRKSPRLSGECGGHARVGLASGHLAKIEAEVEHEQHDGKTPPLNGIRKMAHRLQTRRFPLAHVAMRIVRVEQQDAMLQLRAERAFEIRRCRKARELGPVGSGR